MFALSPRSTIAIRGPVSPGSSTSVIGRRRDLADEVLVLPALDGGRGRAGRVLVRVAGRGHDAAQAAVRAEVAGQRARVDAGDRRDRVVAQQRGQLAGVIEDGGRRVGHDQRPEPRADRLVVHGEPAVVADQRVGHDDDLAGVRGVGADLLVAGLARVDDEVAAGRRRGAEGDAREDRAVLERQQRRTQVADARVDDGAGTGSAAGRSPTAHQAPDTTNPPAAGLGGRGRTRSMDLLRRPHGTDTPASQDRP